MDLFGRNQSSVIQNQGTPDPTSMSSLAIVPGTTVPVTAPRPLAAPPAVQQVDQQAAPHGAT